MENLEETDNITKNIVQEIVRECKKIKLYTDENFCVYYVKLLTLDPLWKISPEKKLNRENIQNIVTFIIAKLKNFNSFDLVTLKIQHTFLSQGSSREILLHSHHQAIIEALSPLLEDILSYTMDDNKQSEHKLYRKIALYSTLNSGLGNPKHMPVLKEAIFALKSILEEDDVVKFLELKREPKMTELQYFQNLISGIRLFHRDCGRPSAEIEDLPKMLSQALIATLLDLQNELLIVMEEVNLATTAIESVFILKRFKTPKLIQKGGKTINVMIQLDLVLPEGIVYQDVQDALNSLILARQCEVYIRKLLKDVQYVENCAKNLFNTLQHALTKLHSCVKYKVAVSTNVVYPLFVDMAETWKYIQDEAVLLSLYHQKFQRINELNATVVHCADKLKAMIGKGEIKSDAMRLETTMGTKIKETQTLCKIVQPASIKEFDNLPLEYLGFCVWSLVQTGGGLIPGNPNMGVCKWKNKYYAFCHAAAAAEFGTEPDIMIMQALTIARKKPELINLFQLHDSISEVRDVGALYQKPVEVIMMVNSGIQTELHPIKDGIDPNYIWDTWDYYRQAIKLANIASCNTHSMQSKKSHYKYSVPTQTTEPRDKVCQTKTDNYMNVATPSNYIFGLRGRKDDTQHIVDLTRPVDEEMHFTCSKAIANPPPYMMKTRKCPSWISEEKPPSRTASSETISALNVPLLPMEHEAVDEEDSQSLYSCICIKNIPIK